MSRKATPALIAGLLLAAAGLGARPVGAASDPFEPNDSWNQATALQSAVAVEAWISPSGDRDWFTFEATRTGQLAVRLESLPADYDLYLARRNPQTQQLDGIPYQNHSGTTPEFFSGYLQATGRYYLRVYADEGIASEDDAYLLTATWPAEAPPDENVLEIGTARGAPGTTATVALWLANDNPAKALQADLRFDPAVATFQSAQLVGRASEMVLAAALQDVDRVRVVLYDDGTEHLPAGAGAVAHLTFTLAGQAGSQCAVTPSGVLLSDLDAGALGITTGAGALTVIDAGVAPQLSLRVLKNPARPRTLQIYAAADQALAAPPVVTAGAVAVAMAPADGAENLYQGTFHAAQEADSLSLSASGTNGVTAGTVAMTVVF